MVCAFKTFSQAPAPPVLPQLQYPVLPKNFPLTYDAATHVLVSYLVASEAESGLEVLGHIVVRLVKSCPGKGPGKELMTLLVPLGCPLEREWVREPCLAGGQLPGWTYLPRQLCRHSRA